MSISKEQAYPIVKELRAKGLTVPQIYKTILKEHGGVACRGGILSLSSLQSLVLYGPALVKARAKGTKKRATVFRPSGISVGKAVEMLRSDLPHNVKIEAALHYLKG